MKILVEKYFYFSKKDSSVYTPDETCIIEDTKENRQKLINDFSRLNKIIGQEDFINKKTNRFDYEYNYYSWKSYGHVLVFTYEQKEKQLKQQLKKDLARLKRRLK